MSIAEKELTVANNVSRVFEAGKKAEYDAFWDVFQRNGNLADHRYAFTLWPIAIFRPKYDLSPTNAGYMFNSFNSGTGNDIINLTKHLENLGVTLDMSRCTNFDYWLYFAWINNVPTIDTRKASSLINMFNSATRTVTVQKMVLKDDGTQTFYTNSSTNCFYQCTALVNIEFEGVIGNNIGFRNSTKLSSRSMASAMEHLSPTATGKTIYFNQTAVNNAAFPITSPTYPEVRYESWEDLVAKTKPEGWTISLVS